MSHLNPAHCLTDGPASCLVRSLHTHTHALALFLFFLFFADFRSKSYLADRITFPWFSFAEESTLQAGDALHEPWPWSQGACALAVCVSLQCAKRIRFRARSLHYTIMLSAASSSYFLFSAKKINPLFRDHSGFFFLSFFHSSKFQKKNITVWTCLKVFFFKSDMTQLPEIAM